LKGKVRLEKLAVGREKYRDGGLAVSQTLKLNSTVRCFLCVGVKEVHDLQRIPSSGFIFL